MLPKGTTAGGGVAGLLKMGAVTYFLRDGRKGMGRTVDNTID